MPGAGACLWGASSGWAGADSALLNGGSIAGTWLAEEATVAAEVWGMRPTPLQTGRTAGFLDFFIKNSRAYAF